MNPRDFSIEEAALRIPDARTRAYFEEVHRNYVAMNYRSCVVGLWSVVVCDLLFKLEELVASYGDAAATLILTDIRAKQQTNPRSPEWEAELVRLVAEKTHLLDTGDKSSLDYLQQQRHLCAHPILTGSIELHSPTKDTARALLRSTLEGVLLKPTVWSRKIFETFVEDLESKKTLLDTDEDLRRYLSAKYFPHFSPAVEKSIFRSLWKLVFRSTDNRATTNRNVNFRALKLIHERHRADVPNWLSAEPGYYGEVSDDGVVLEKLCVFIALRPELWPALNQAVHVIVENAAKQDNRVRFLAWFTTGMEEHLASIKTSVETGTLEVSGANFRALRRIAEEHGLEQAVHAIGIAAYGKSDNFDEADIRYSELISESLQSWSEETFSEFVRVVECHCQTWWRGRARVDHGNVKTVFESRFKGPFPKPAKEDVAKTFGFDAELPPRGSAPPPPPPFLPPLPQGGSVP